MTKKSGGGGRERAVREEFETLSRVARRIGGGGWRKGGSMAAGLRETESAPALQSKNPFSF